MNSAKLKSEIKPSATAMTSAVATMPRTGCLRPDMSAPSELRKRWPPPSVMTGARVAATDATAGKRLVRRRDEVLNPFRRFASSPGDSHLQHRVRLVERDHGRRHSPRRSCGSSAPFSARHTPSPAATASIDAWSPGSACSVTTSGATPAAAYSARILSCASGAQARSWSNNGTSASCVRRSDRRFASG